jgi:hypothetical protein
MIVSNCCGAEFHDLETKICVCCNEHADEVVKDKPSVDVAEIKEYNYNSYQRGVVASMVEKYGSLEKAIFEMEAKIASLELTIEVMREENDWSTECGVLYGFLIEHNLMSKYHHWSKK